MYDSTGQVADRLHKLVQDPPNLALINSAPDKNIALVYADAGTADERIITATYTAASLPGVTVVITLTYAGIAGGYYLTTVQYS